MTEVVLSPAGMEEFKEIIKTLTDEDKISLRYWISYVQRNGIGKAQLNPSFRDHKLRGNWEGYRAASFGYSSRIIYRIINDDIEIVEIERITTNHNYKRTL